MDGGSEGGGGVGVEGDGICRMGGVGVEGDGIYRMGAVLGVRGLFRLLEEEEGGDGGELGLVDEGAFFVDVLDGDISLLEGSADEFATVAVGGFAFAAEQGDADAFFVSGDDAFEAFEEEGLDADEVIVEFAKAIVAGGVGRAAAEGVAHIDIAEACCADGGDQFGLSVLGIEGGVGDGADVDEEFDGVLLQQLDEVGERTGAMADGEDHNPKEIS